MANPVLLQKKYTRIIACFAEKEKLSLNDALSFFYHSKLYTLISEGVSDLAGNVPIIMGKVMESVKEATGIDMNEIIRAETFEGKTTKNINFTGLEQVGEEIAQGAAQSVSETMQKTE